MRPDSTSGLISWFARNPVAANLLMMVLIIVGAYSLVTIKKEAQPRMPVTNISITVPFFGAAPEEIEQGILLKLEAALKDVEGIAELNTYATEQGGSAKIRVATNDGYTVDTVMDRVEQAVSTISRFPSEAEKPIITPSSWQQAVLRIQISGDMDDRTRKQLAEEIRDELLQLPEISKANIQGVLPTEIAIEIPERQLRRYGLTLDHVAAVIRASSIDLSGGAIESGSGDIRIRTIGQAYRGEEFEKIILITQPDGTRITVGDIATVRDTFIDIPFYSMFNGKSSVMIEVFAVGNQSQLEVSRAAKEYVEKKAHGLPAGIAIDTWGDISVFIAESVDLMTRNLMAGAIMVFVVLGIFLRLKLAAWVMVGIPVSFLGTGMLMPLPGFDLTVNMMSIFGFFIVLGIVVDDAIIIGESAYTEIEKYGQSIDNVIIGVKRVAIPATFGVLTTIATFGPLVFSGGDFNAFSRVIGWVVILCLIFSIVESKLILPAHLAHMSETPPRWRITKLLSAIQQSAADGLRRLIHNRYRPLVIYAIKHRYTTVTIFVALLIIVGGMFAGGIIRYVFSPSVPDKFIRAQVELVEGVPKELGLSIAKRLSETLLEAGSSVSEKYHIANNIVGNNMAVLTPQNTVIAVAELDHGDNDDIDPEELATKWRALVGDIAGTTSMRIRSANRAGGPALSFKLSANDTLQIEQAAQALMTHLRSYDGVYEIESSQTSGPRELQLQIKHGAEAIGLTQAALATQVRQAFYGVEAQRINRDRGESRVMVRYPKSERQSVGNLEAMWIRSPSGQEIPFDQVATMIYDDAPTRIYRQDGDRVVVITANVDTLLATPASITKSVYQDFGELLQNQYPTVKLQQTGASEREQDTISEFGRNFAISLLLVYALMAIPLKSYLQPLIVMSVIPFGLIGALLGHYFLGYAVSSVSIMGLIALTGVVVNDGIILVDYVNKAVATGVSSRDAAVDAGTARFRAILLTSLTTFIGLSPMLAETSFQAALMMPMAIALAFGILFSTTMTLILIPCLYIIMDDLQSFFGINNNAVNLDVISDNVKDPVPRVK